MRHNWHKEQVVPLICHSSKGLSTKGLNHASISWTSYFNLNNLRISLLDDLAIYNGELPYLFFTLASAPLSSSALTISTLFFSIALHNGDDLDNGDF